MNFKKHIIKRFATLLIAIAMLVPVAFATQVQAQPLAGFNHLVITAPNSLYTEILLPGLDKTVYAFNDIKGVTQFRVYGSYNNILGYYPITVTAGEDYEEGQPLQFALASDKPIKDRMEDAGKAVIPKENIVIPAGFSPARTHGLVYVENLFGQKEYRAYASYDNNTTFVYVPTQNSRPKPGALGRVTEDMLTRAKIAGERNFAVPEALKNGFAELVLIKTNDNVELSVSTAYPELNAGEIRALAAQSVVIVPPYDYVYEERKTAAQRNHELNSKDDIRQIQIKLNELGFDAGAVDGLAGEKTVAAIKAFQKANGLSQDGIVGKYTWAKLFSGVVITQAPKPLPTATPEPQKKGEPYFAIANTTGGDLNIWKTPELIGKNAKINALYSVKNGEDIGMVQEYEEGYAEVLDETGGFVRVRYLKEK
ncbi:MAG: peptidoglycan-binding domain-containing protein [Eubacteriales bacterium]|nr:peptidoglycan-binding domain-containing protein [Eubacteriales bacterium]